MFFSPTGVNHQECGRTGKKAKSHALGSTAPARLNWPVGFYLEGFWGGGGAWGDDSSFGGKFTLPHTRARARAHVCASRARDPASACLKDPDFAVAQLYPNTPTISARS